MNAPKLTLIAVALLLAESGCARRVGGMRQHLRTAPVRAVLAEMGAPEPDPMAPTHDGSNGR